MSSIYDDDSETQGIGSPPMNGPNFERPEGDGAPQYAASPEVAAAETANEDQDDQPDESTTQENDAIEKNDTEGGGFVKNTQSFLKTKSPSGINFAKSRRKQGMIVGAGIVMFIVVTVISILFTFNIPSAQVRAAGNGLFNTYLGSQVYQNKIHFGNYWNGTITDYVRQQCVGSECTLKGTPKSWLEKKTSFLGAARDKSARFAIQKMQVKGVQIMGENGKATGLRINTEKTGSPYVSETDAAKLKATIEKQTGLKVSVEKVSGSRYGGTFKVTTRSLTGVNNQRLLYSMATETKAINKAGAKVGFLRNSSKVLGLGFHPLKMLRESYTSKINGVVDTYLKGLLGENTGKPRTAAITGKVDGKETSSGSTNSSYESMKSAANSFLESRGGKAAGGALGAIGIACIAASIVDGTNTIVLQNNLYPAARLSTTYMAAGETATAVVEPDVDWQGFDAFGRMLEVRNEDGTINSFSQSAVWKHANGTGGGKELDSTRSAALGLGSVDPTIKQELGVVVSTIGTAVCSGAIGSILTAAGIGVMIISGPAAIIEGAAIAGALTLAMPAILKTIAGSEVDLAQYQNDPASLYNMAGSGAKFLRDVSSWAHGGSSQSSADQAKYSTLAYNERADEFREKPLMARIFDIQDPMSLAGKIAANSSRYPSQNLASLSGSFVSVFSNSTNIIGSLLFKKTFAATLEGYDICTQDKWGCTGLSEAVMNDDASIAIDYLAKPSLTDSDSKLDWMKRCHDDQFYQDSSLNNVWTFRVIDNTPAFFKHLAGALDDDCYDAKMLDDPVIVSLMSYTNLEPQEALQVCIDATNTSTDPLDIAACAKQGYDGSTSDPVSTSTPTQTTSTTKRAPSESGASINPAQTHTETKHDSNTKKRPNATENLAIYTHLHPFAKLYSQRRYVLDA